MRTPPIRDRPIRFLRILWVFSHRRRTGCGSHGDYRLAPFVRWERYNMGSRKRHRGSGGAHRVGPALRRAQRTTVTGPRNQDRVWTLGANFYTTPHVVFKVDYQWFDLNSDLKPLST